MQADDSPKLQRELIKPGLYLDMDDDYYHRKTSGTSSSQLKSLIELPPNTALYNWNHPKEDTPATALGKWLHAMCLEPHRIDIDFAVPPPFNKRTKQGKADYLAWKQEHAHQTEVSQEAVDTGKRMADSLWSDPSAQVLLEDSINESSIFWWYKCQSDNDDREYKELLKIRPDIASKSHSLLADIKTTDDATESGFMKSIRKFYYHLSESMYLEGANQSQELLNATGNSWFTDFVFICVEKHPPYNVALYRLTPEAKAEGRHVYQTALRRLHDARQDQWPGIPEGVRPIGLPGYTKYIHMI